MTKKRGIGGNKKRKAKAMPNKPSEMVYKSDGQVYARVIRALGNGFLEVNCFHKDERITRRAHIRGSIKKKGWINEGDYVLVALRNFNDKTCDVLAKYTNDQANMLKSRGDIPEEDINDEEIDFSKTQEVKQSQVILVPAQTRDFTLEISSDSELEDDLEKEIDEL